MRTEAFAGPFDIRSISTLTRARGCSVTTYRTASGISVFWGVVAVPFAGGMRYVSIHDGVVSFGKALKIMVHQILDFIHRGALNEGPVLPALRIGGVPDQAFVIFGSLDDDGANDPAIPIDVSSNGLVIFRNRKNFRDRDAHGIVAPMFWAMRFVCAKARR